MRRDFSVSNQILGLCSQDILSHFLGAKRNIVKCRRQQPSSTRAYKSIRARLPRRNSEIKGALVFHRSFTNNSTSCGFTTAPGSVLVAERTIDGAELGEVQAASLRPLHWMRTLRGSSGRPAAVMAPLIPQASRHPRSRASDTPSPRLSVTDAGRCTQGICRLRLEVRTRRYRRRDAARCAEFRFCAWTSGNRLLNPRLLPGRGNGAPASRGIRRSVRRSRSSPRTSRARISSIIR